MGQTTQRRLSLLLTGLGSMLAIADAVVFLRLGNIAWWPRHLSVIMLILVLAGVAVHPTPVRIRF